jgi:hypothetical protein
MALDLLLTARLLLCEALLSALHTSQGALKTDEPKHYVDALIHCKCLHLDDNCKTNKSCRAVAGIPGIQLLVAGMQLFVAGVQLLLVICTTGVQLEYS